MSVPKDELRILFVDDSAVSRKLAKFVFQGKPYEVIFAEGGKQALELVASYRPDVVITDLVMPDLSVWTCAAWFARTLDPVTLT